ncbi:MAG: tetratricopeptide repeat protein [Ignavibacteria bacterium]|nr:tetratricopeptide repeat protein [Ignavibacteria bacterium]
MKPFFRYSLFLFALLSVTVRAGSNDSLLNLYSKDVYTAAYTYNTKLMISLHDKLAELYAADTTNAGTLYLLAYTENSLLTMSMNPKQTELYELYQESAVLHAKTVISFGKFSVEGKALLASTYMMMISHNWSNAVALSPKINALLDQAAAVEPENPRILYMKGVMKFNTPEMFGGSKEAGLQLLLQANGAFEKAPETQPVIRWGQLETLAWIGQAYMAHEDPETAMFYYQKALSIEPNFGWVKYQLIPQAKKK